MSPTKTVTLTPDQALAQAESGVDSALFVSAVFTPPRAGLAAPRGLAFVTRAASKDNGDLILGEWEADLVAGAVAELLTASGPISGSIGTVMESAVTADGVVVDGGSGYPMSAALAGTEFPAAQLTDNQITEKLAGIATGSGLTVSSIRVLHPLNPAPIVILRLPLSGQFTLEQFSDLEDSLFGIPPQGLTCDYEGYYLELDSSSGQPLVRDAGTTRTGIGSSWEASNAPFEIPSGGPARLMPTIGGPSAPASH